LQDMFPSAIVGEGRDWAALQAQKS
jgi:hypothetical protein